MQRGIASDHVAGILGGLRAQRHPKCDVALGLTQRRQIQSLAAEGEEDVAAAAFLTDVDHQFDPLRVVVEQLEVLVDDDQQDRNGLQVAAGQPHLFVLVGVTGAGILEKPVAPGDFAVDGFAHPFGEMPVILAEVGQRARNMRQTLRSWAADSNFMSTKITMKVSGEWVSAIPLHNDRKNSDLPEPEVPITTE